MVQGSQPYKVRLSWYAAEGWDGVCTCPMQFSCKHLYAAMKALLAEHSVAAVRGLSSGLAGQTKVGSAPAKERLERRPESLAAAVRLTLGRTLRKEENHFLAQLSEMYGRCAVTHRITRWDFDQIGLSLGGHGWDALYPVGNCT